MAVEKYKLGTIATLLSTELNSLANNTNAISSTSYNNAQGGGGGDGYTEALLELFLNYSVAPTANTGFSIWFLTRPDGTNFEDGGASVTPARTPNVVVPVRAVTGNQRIVRRVMIPPGVFHTLIRNNGTGQTIASSGNTVKLLPFTPEGV